MVEVLLHHDTLGVHMPGQGCFGMAWNLPEKSISCRRKLFVPSLLTCTCMNPHQAASAWQWPPSSPTSWCNIYLRCSGAAMEAFGQSEALTTRLRHIIESYADGPGILMELIQNADDAGATNVAFMLDLTSYPTNSLLGETCGEGGLLPRAAGGSLLLLG